MIEKSTNAPFSSIFGGILLLALYPVLVWSAINCHIVSYDGATNAQAAWNLFTTGKLLLDYPPYMWLQTGFPFQLISGFLLYLFGKSFTVLAIPGIIFAGALFVTSLWLTMRIRNPAPCLCIIAFFLSPNAYSFAFDGYGEMPSFLFALLGAIALTLASNPIKACLLGGSGFGLAIATKLTCGLLLPGTLLILVLRRDLTFRHFLIFVVALLTVGGVFLGLQYSVVPQHELERMVGAVLRQSSPMKSLNQGEIIATPSAAISRFETFWNVFRHVSFSEFAALKLILPLCGLLVVFLRIPAEASHQKRVQLLFLYLVASAVLYYGWYLLLSSRPWSRRFLQADLLFFFALGVLPGIFTLSRLSRAIHLGFCSLFVLSYASYFYYQTTTEHACEVLELEQGMKSTLRSLPGNYVPLGYPGALAPVWAFHSDRVFGVAISSPVILAQLKDKRPRYLFVEDQKTLEPTFYDFLMNHYELRQVFKRGNFEAYEIKGISDKGKRYASTVDFSKLDAELFYSSSAPLKQVPRYLNRAIELSELAVFLDNSSGYSELSVQFSILECKSHLKIYAAFSDGETWSPPLELDTNAGLNELTIPIPAEFRSGQMKWYLMRGEPFQDQVSPCEGLPREREFLTLKRVELQNLTGSSLHE